MKTSLTLSSLFALFGALVVLAAVPGVSVLTVITQSATYGFSQGMLTALGIVVGDLVWIAIALSGWALITATLGAWTILLQYAAGVYLIALGLSRARSHSTPAPATNHGASSRLSSFLLGLSITLGDQKATLFYLGFFPAFLDLATLSPVDATLLILTTVLAVGGVKVGYALLADRAKLRISSPLKQGMTVISSAIMVVAGLILLAKA